MTSVAVPSLPLPIVKPIDDRVPIDPDKLRALRESRRLSFTEMGTAVGGVENTYRAIEAGRRDPKLSQVLGILKAFGLTTRDLPKILPKDQLF